MTTEFNFRVVVRGNVTPEQWHAIHGTVPEMLHTVRVLEDLFRERLNAHEVRIDEVIRIREPRV